MSMTIPGRNQAFATETTFGEGSRLDFAGGTHNFDSPMEGCLGAGGNDSVIILSSSP